MCKITYRILYHTIQRLKPSQMPIGRVLTILWFILSVNVIDSEVNKKTPLGSSVRDLTGGISGGGGPSSQYPTPSCGGPEAKSKTAVFSLFLACLFPSCWWVCLSSCGHRCCRPPLLSQKSFFYLPMWTEDDLRPSAPDQDNWGTNLIDWNTAGSQLLQSVAGHCWTTQPASCKSI